MPYKVLLHPKAAKALQKFDDTNKLRLKKALTQLTADPDTMGEPLHPSIFWKIRADDYRAIYKIDSAKKEVIVIFMGHLKSVYDDFSKIL